MRTAMRTDWMVRLVAAALLLAGVGSWFVQMRPGYAQEALGTVFTYQGQLTRDGVLVSEACTMRFALFDAAQGGTQQGATVTVANVAVDGGFFTVDLDFGADAFAGEARYLEIGVQCSGESSFTTLNGRVALRAAPAALFARRAPWGGLLDVPAGFADNVDNDTTYTAGAGLVLATGTELALDTAYLDAGYWRLGGTTGALTPTLGTTDNLSLTLVVSNTPALRIYPGGGQESANLIGGSFYNQARAGTVGIVIAGGGSRPGLHQAHDSYTTIGGGLNHTVGSDDADNANARFATVGGGFQNRAIGQDATVSGGGTNIAVGQADTVGGGNANGAGGGWSTVSGGNINIAQSRLSFIGGGFNNRTTPGAEHATIGGGFNNTASATDATVGGGRTNEAAGTGATVPGGQSNTAAGAYSFAAGRAATAQNDRAFVWNGSSNEVTSAAAGSFVAAAPGGFALYSAENSAAGVTLAPGSGTWQSVSDRNAKANIAPVDSRAVLEGVARLPIATWNYTTQAASIRHMGPMAQDFYATFGLGTGATTISTVDADGVALAAIQALYAEVQAKDAEIAAQQAQIDQLEARLQALEERASTSGSPVDSSLPILALLALGVGGFGLLRGRGYPAAPSKREE